MPWWRPALAHAVLLCAAVACDGQAAGADVAAAIMSDAAGGDDAGASVADGTTSVVADAVGDVDGDESEVDTTGGGVDDTPEASDLTADASEGPDSSNALDASAVEVGGDGNALDGDVDGAGTDPVEQAWLAKVGQPVAKCSDLMPMCVRQWSAEAVLSGDALKKPDFSDPSTLVQIQMYQNGKAVATEGWRRATVLHGFGYKPGSYESSSVGRWLPVSIEEKAAGAVDIYATWINQVRIFSSEQQAKKYTIFKHVSVGGLESLLPSGCLRFRIDTKSAKVIETTLVASEPDEFWTSNSNFESVVGCAASIGKAPEPGGKTIQHKAPSGWTIVAHPGRPRPERQLDDVFADLSQLVRAEPAIPGLPGQPTEAAIELVAPDGTKTPIDADVSFCHATPTNVADSGCGCDAPPMPAQPTMSGESFVEIVTPPLAVTITESWLAQAFGSTWNGVGQEVGESYPYPSPWPCCSTGLCTYDSPKFLCAGWSLLKPQWNESLLAAFWGTMWKGQRLMFLWFSCNLVSSVPKPTTAEILDMLPALAPSWLEGQASLNYSHLPTALPHTQRDARWLAISAGSFSKVSFYDYGKYHADVGYAGEAQLSRRTAFAAIHMPGVMTKVPFKARMRVFHPKVP